METEQVGKMKKTQRSHIVTPLMVLVLSFLAGGRLGAQENILSNGLELGIGARAIAMGGAYSAVGEDYSASYWNPAGLALVRRFEISGGLSRFQNQTDSRFQNTSMLDEETFTRLNEFGIVYPVPTYRGSLVFSFGYNRIKNYDNNFAFGAFNPLAEDQVDQNWREYEVGTLNQWTAAGAVDLSPAFSVGLSMNFITGKDDYTFTFKERDRDDIYTFADFRRDDSIISSLSGFNMTIGGLYRVNSELRLSAYMITPSTITISENWQTVEVTTFDEDPSESSDEGGQFQYKMRMPYIFGAGAAFNFAGLLLAGNIELLDWKQVRYETEPPLEGLSRAEANDQIRDTFRSTTRIRLGAEYTIPKSRTQIRAGYYIDPSPLYNATTTRDRELYSLGLGLLLDKQVKLDIAYVFGEWEETDPFDNNYVTSLTRSISYKRLLATLSIRL
ncbi:MAG TPA: hypothetical protein ENJ29_10380 [Bacteroidetes bacterium]|nr:hypothetical protein [Bacteroidota bacterium]